MVIPTYRTPSEMRNAAWHVAGHAVMAVLGRLPLRWISIAPTRSSWAQVALDRPPEWFKPHVVVTPRTRARIEAMIRARWGGIAAQQLLVGQGPWGHPSEKEAWFADQLGRRYGGRAVLSFVLWQRPWLRLGRSDEQAAHRLAGHLGVGTEPTALARWLLCQTWDVLGQPLPWLQVQAVATALLLEDSLPGSKVKQLMEDARERAGREPDTLVDRRLACETLAEERLARLRRRRERRWATAASLPTRIQRTPWMRR